MITIKTEKYVTRDYAADKTIRLQRDSHVFCSAFDNCKIELAGDGAALVDCRFEGCHIVAADDCRVFYVERGYFMACTFDPLDLVCRAQPFPFPGVAEVM